MNQNQDWTKSRTRARSDEPDERIRAYIEKIATGPRLSKNLTPDEAEDGLRLILDKAVSDVRAGVFLIASRIKIETAEETLGFWKALDDTTEKREVKFDKLLQIADAFDGFLRTPYFGFYTMPVLGAMGLPAFGLSSLPTPPKFGTTFEDLLINHYGFPKETTLDQRKELIEKFGFGYVGTEQCHPKLEGLRGLREDVIKRTLLSTLEKMLMPLKAKQTVLASNYFHIGFEASMLEVGKVSGFDKTLIGNGMEGTTLYGIHKQAKVYAQMGDGDAAEVKMDYESIYDADTAGAIKSAFEALKDVSSTKENLSQLGEQALQGEGGPATPMIAHHAATLAHLAGHSPDIPTAYQQAVAILKSGECFQSLTSFIKSA